MKTSAKFLFLLGALVVAVVLSLWLRPKVALRPTSTSVPAQLQPQPPPPLLPQLAKDVQSTVEAKPVTPLSQRRFKDMKAVERNAILENLRKQDFPVILQAWIEADQVEHDPLKHGQLGTLLGFAMHDRVPSPEFLAQLRSFIYNPANSELDRGVLIVALGFAARNETLEMLLDMVAHPPSKELLSSSLSAIGTASLNRDESLTPFYERVWREAGSGDKDLLKNIACSLGRLGTPSSMEMLLTAAFAPNGQDDVRKQAALFGLSWADILNDKAVPPLAARLSNDAPSGEASRLAASILFKMQTTDANQALLTWIQHTDASNAKTASKLATETQHPEIWRAALDPSVTFRSERNREAIRDAMEIRKGR
jgi:hypothetical protein